MRGNEKMFLLYINIESKCLNINIYSVSITKRVAKILSKFPWIPRFRFEVQGQNKNTELVENFLQHVYRKLYFPNSYQMSLKAALVHMSSSQFGQDLLLFWKNKLQKILLLFFISKKCENDFLMDISIDSKCLNIGI